MNHPRALRHIGQRFRLWSSTALLAALWLGPSSAALAKLRVVTTVQTFRALAAEIGGDRVEVTALVGEAVDPHKVDPRPSYAVLLNRADLLVHVGLDLEKAWLPPLVEQSRNPRIQSGQTGNLNASTVGISVLDVGAGVSRAMGDVHPMGNPHYWLPPDNALKIARAIADRLKALDAGNAAAYDQGYTRLAAAITAKQAEWNKRAAGLRGVKVVTYHKSWTYLTRWLGLVEIGYVEPKPGVPPDPAHLVRLVEEARRAGARFCLVEAYYPRSTAQRVVDLAKMKLLPLASDAGGKQSYTALVDAILAALTG
jgi:zinc/manganese transport system substrate-binding protein